MTMTEKQSYYETIYPRYHRTSRKEKTQILDEYCQVCGISVKVCSSQTEPETAKLKKEKRDCRPLYHKLTTPKVIKMCSKRLIAALPEWLPNYEQRYDYVYWVGKIFPAMNVSTNTKAGGTLHTYLRCQKSYRKRALSGQDHRDQICNRTDIEKRPVEAVNRKQIGDYEGDTVIGKGHQVALVTLVDRNTRETKIRALIDRKAVRVTQACISMLKAENHRSITFDSDKKFADAKSWLKRYIPAFILLNLIDLGKEGRMRIPMG